MENSKSYNITSRPFRLTLLHTHAHPPLTIHLWFDCKGNKWLQVPVTPSFRYSSPFTWAHTKYRTHTGFINYVTHSREVPVSAHFSSVISERKKEKEIREKFVIAQKIFFRNKIRTFWSEEKSSPATSISPSSAVETLPKVLARSGGGCSAWLSSCSE